MNLVCIFDKQIRAWAWTEDATSLSHDFCLCNSSKRRYVYHRNPDCLGYGVSTYRYMQTSSSMRLSYSPSRLQTQLQSFFRFSSPRPAISNVSLPGLSRMNSTLIEPGNSSPLIERQTKTDCNPLIKGKPNDSLAQPDDGSPLIKVQRIPAPILGHICILSLNSPWNKNAISLRFLNALRTELSRISRNQNIIPNDQLATHDKDGHDTGSLDKELVKEKGSEKLGPTRALIITSDVAGVFSAGADLKERAQMTQEQTKIFLKQIRSTFTQLSSLPVPTISAVAGRAVGGGFELALATDFRIFHTSTAVSLPEVLLGIIPGAGGTYRLPALIGQSNALEIILTGRLVKSIEAARLGICNYVVADTEDDQNAQRRVLWRAKRLAQEICAAAPLSTRAALAAGRIGTMLAENSEYEKVLGTSDRDEGLAAVLKKRPTVFRGC